MFQVKNYRTIFFVLALSFCTVLNAAPPALQLANVYHEHINLNDYWVSEKLDGVRAYWDGKQLISRQGNVIHAPAWFTQHFPSIALDGELWIDRNQFELVSGIVRQQQPDDNQWRQVRFMVFDLPQHPGIFTQRLLAMQTIIAEISSPYLQWIPQYRINDHQALMLELDKIVQQGGEGLMLHRGNSYYQAVRNDDVLKVKQFFDAEAVVIAHLPGTGKYTGMMGALLVENSEDKIRFKIGTGFSDAQRRNPPPIGSVITYQYLGKTKNNLPRFASFLRIKTDHREQEPQTRAKAQNLY